MTQSGINFDNLHASEPSSDFRRNHIADSIMFFDLFSPRSCRRRTMGYFGKQSPKHYFGFQHAGQNSMESGYDYVWQFRMPYIVCEKYLMWLFYSSNNLGWFACFRIQYIYYAYSCIMLHLSMQTYTNGRLFFLFPSPKTDSVFNPQLIGFTSLHPHFAWPAWRIVFQVGIKKRLFKANQLIRDLPCDSCETCQESTGRGLQQLVKRENYCPGVVVFIQFLGISSRFDSFSQLQLSSFQIPLSSLYIAWFIAITNYQLMDYDKPQYIW